jgi:hypothetical protein
MGGLVVWENESMNKFSFVNSSSKFLVDLNVSKIDIVSSSFVNNLERGQKNGRIPEGQHRLQLGQGGLNVGKQPLMIGK